MLKRTILVSLSLIGSAAVAAPYKQPVQPTIVSKPSVVSQPAVVSKPSVASKPVQYSIGNYPFAMWQYYNKDKANSSCYRSSTYIVTCKY